MRAPGERSSDPRTASRSDSSNPASSCTRWRSACSKSISPAMAASVTAATWAPQPHRSASRSITSPCRRVESASSTIRCLARRCRPSTWTAMSTSDRTASSARARRKQVQISSRHGELVAVHGVGGEPHDPLDVSLALGDPCTDALQRRRRDLGRQNGDQEPVVLRGSSASRSGAMATSTLTGRKLVGDRPAEILARLGRRRPPPPRRAATARGSAPARRR